ncbi:hypothetical protein EVJ50_06140 [Synechococcus sp. RSCCF101]|uniref:ABC transporter transmembrane domain-containing protein n=1 Tax=Synechococcus sp. RSCCF101 TaxID=2511069 RepID=UPI001246DD59|nr:ABC transporter transmembrane domain-containing protein [Synechococcus sp. RSCCF101]QEY31883.1 hypothetical protein EVJ50_06140 [Synechococcus sp. RSCCF101]
MTEAARADDSQGLRSWWRDPLGQFRRVNEENIDLLAEFFQHPFFQSVIDSDWSRYQIGPIITASIVINLLELASPLYINLVYTQVLPTGSLPSLAVLTLLVLLLLLLSGVMKIFRLSLTGNDSAHIEHTRRMNALSHFTQLRLSEYLRASPSTHADRLSTISILRDESSIQALTTSIDLVFSLFFVLVLFLIGGTIGFIGLIAIAVYLLRALSFARQLESAAKQRDLLEQDRLGYHGQIVRAISQIKSNGLGRKFLVGNEERQEDLSRVRIRSNTIAAKYQSFSSLMSQITLAATVTWGGILVINDRLLVGALAACLLLAGKVLSPWQQAMSLWNSYRRFTHSRSEYEHLMNTPTEDEGGSIKFEIGDVFAVSMGSRQIATVPTGGCLLLRDSNYGTDVRHLFMGLLQIETVDDLQIGGRPIHEFNRYSLRQSIAYADPSLDFFEGSLLQNITSFQPAVYRRHALFWSFLTGLDSKVRSLPQGYATTMGSSVPSGLSSDVEGLFQIIRALTTGPDVLLLNLYNSSFGKEFIVGLEKILKRCRGRTTVLLAGSGNVLSKLSDHSADLPLLDQALSPFA